MFNNIPSGHNLSIMVLTLSILISLIGWIDLIFLLSWLLFSSLELMPFLLLHFTAVGLHLTICRIGHVPSLFYGLLNTALPGIGCLTQAIQIWATDVRKIHNEMVNQYQDHIAFLTDFTMLKDVDLEEEVNIMSVIDNLAFANGEKKKHSVIHIDTDDLPKKISLLRKALLDSDPEVVHYSASTLNSIEESLVEELTELKQKFTEKPTPDLLKNLTGKMKIYIDSGLNDADLVIPYVKDYFEMLLMLENENPHNDELQLERARLYNYLKDYQKSVSLLEVFVANHPDHADAHLALMEAYYYLKQHHKVQEIAMSCLNCLNDVSESDSRVFQYWLKEATG